LNFTRRYFLEMSKLQARVTRATSSSAAGPGWFGDPMEVALVQFAADAMPALPHNPRVAFARRVSRRFMFSGRYS
jgi:hypothetical protein